MTWKLTKAQRDVLTELADGHKLTFSGGISGRLMWHSGKAGRTRYDTVFNLWKVALVSSADYGVQGHVYRITPAGRAALASTRKEP
jgi:hypothetical protein